MPRSRHRNLKQMQKIYDLENAYSSDNTTPEAMQAWIDWILRTKWWRDRSKIRHIRVVFPIVGKKSGAYREEATWARIEFGVFSLSRQTACHELSHILAWNEEGDDEEDHDDIFAGMYLSLCRRFISAEWSGKMETDFDEKGIKHKYYD